MTNITPEQYRALADEMFGAAYNDPNAVRVSLMTEAAIALRTATDQLEAVNAILDERWEEDHSDAYYLDLHTDAENRIRRVLTADTAPQEGDTDD